VKIYEKTWRLGRMLLAGVLALLFAVVLLTLLSHYSVVAEPTQAMTVEKEASTTHAGPGDTLTYTVRIQNNVGPPISSVWLTDTLVDELDFVSGSLTATYGTFGTENGVITWTSDLGTEVYITFSARISPEITYATIVNTAEVTGDGELVADSATTEVGPGNLVASKSVYPSSASIGEQLGYTIRITNTGHGSVGAAQMSDALPPEVDYFGNLNATKGSWGEAGDVVTWSGSLAHAEWVVVTFDAQIASGLSDNPYFVNTAEVTGAGSLVTASAGATAITEFKLWLPLIFHYYPPIPELDSIPTPGDNNSYRVSWESIVTDPSHDGYVLQEATDADFTEDVEQWATSTTYRDFEKGLEIGTYYYRVRVDDADRWGQGPWSNVKSVSFGYYDDFSSSSSGWPNRGGLIWDGGEWDVWWYTRYLTSVGQYQIKIDNGPAPVTWFWQPDAMAPYRPPTNKYCVETEVKFREPYGWWANAGLVFGANESNTDLYMLCLGIGAKPHLGWFVARNSDYDFPHIGCATKSGKIAEGEEGTDYYGWNKLQVGVDGNKAKVYVGGYHVGSWTMDGLIYTTRVGIVGGDYEVSDNDIRFDYFKVVPNVSCEP